MAGKGITKNVIFEAAIELVAEKGFETFSLRELAARLEVKPASLYSHIEGVAEICTAVGMTSIERLEEALAKAGDKEERDAAFLAITEAYRRFAVQNPGLYRAIMSLPSTTIGLLKQNEGRTIAPLMDIVARYVEDHDDAVNFIRFYRSAMHGFIMLEGSGFMRDADIPHDASYKMLTEACLEKLKSISEKNLN